MTVFCVQGLLTAHDKVAQQKAVPTKTTTDDDDTEYITERASQYGEESIKIVRLQKTADPLVGDSSRHMSHLFEFVLFDRSITVGSVLSVKYLVGIY